MDQLNQAGSDDLEWQHDEIERGAFEEIDSIGLVFWRFIIFCLVFAAMVGVLILASHGPWW